MTTKNIRELYATHNSKIADKWDSFFETYQRIIDEKSQSIESMLEIGVQNGGSLEIWAQLLPNAKKIIGCDIDPRCSSLEYTDRRIKILIGDATSIETANLIRKQKDSYELIVDDGSHQSVHIIKTFLLLFQNIADGGVYVVEDLHCSYWSEFGGGLYFPFSAMSFFKALADIVSFQSWGISLSRSERLKAFSNFLNVKISEMDLSRIEAVEFAASMCVIRKKSNESVQSALRIVTGHVSLVDAEPQSIRNTPLEPPDQTLQFWSNNTYFSNGNFETHVFELSARISQLENLQIESAEKSELISQLQSEARTSANKMDALQGAFDKIVGAKASLRTALVLQQKVAFNADRINNEYTAELKTELGRYVDQNQDLKVQICSLNSQREDEYLQAERLRNEIISVKQTNFNLLNSSSWKITKPFRFLKRLFAVKSISSIGHLQTLAATQSNPLGTALNARTRVGNVYRFWRSNGTRELLRLVNRKISPVINLAVTESLVRPATAEPGDLLAVKTKAKSVGISVAQMIADRYHRRLVPFGTYEIKGAPATGRVTIITDSLNPNSLFGGVGTALIFGALLAEARSGSLRILTRQEKARPDSIASVLDTNSIVLSKEVEFLHCLNGGESKPINIEAGEIFITTSWWTTAAAIDSVPIKSIVYLLQEDERMFYPFDDERLRCSSILSRSDLQYVVNTGLLLSHFKAEGLISNPNNWQSFEPAFPRRASATALSKVENRRMRLMFYARPNNVRNLFYFGIELIQAAIQTGRFVVTDWELVMVGVSIPDIDFGPDVKIVKYENLAWAQYMDLMKTIDLGLCLMYTPHPSYPPLDLAANGAVVLTNKFGCKNDLSQFSTNIICADLTLESMLTSWDEALEKITANTQLTPDKKESVNSMSRSWKNSLSETVEAIEKGHAIV